jgi:hypothetical protein
MNSPKRRQPPRKMRKAATSSPKRAPRLSREAERPGFASRDKDYLPPGARRLPSARHDPRAEVVGVFDAVYRQGGWPQRTADCALQALGLIKRVTEAEAIVRKHGGLVRWRPKRLHLDAQHLGRAVMDGMPVSFGSRDGQGVALIIGLLMLAGWKRQKPSTLWHVLHGFTSKKRSKRRRN